MEELDSASSVLDDLARDYSRAIDILVGIDPRECYEYAVELAKTYPSVLVRIHEQIAKQNEAKRLEADRLAAYEAQEESRRNEETQFDQVMNLVKAGKFVEAVKQRRQMTGEGLKEAKDYVDALREGLEDADRISGVKSW